jgi:hypothetical protein
MNLGNVRWNFVVQIFQKREQFHLPFALIGLPPNLTRASIKGGEQVECAKAFLTSAPLSLWTAV